MIRLEQTMRWFGPSDPVTLQSIRQSGCSGVVTALYHLPPGEVWEREEIQKWQQWIEGAGLKWSVVESLPVHEDIKRRSGNYHSHIQNYNQSIRNLAAENIRVITYNFMPVLDWVRTDHAFTLPDGSKALRFDIVDFAAFDLFLLLRKDAERDYNEQIRGKAERKFAGMTAEHKVELYRCVLMGLPGVEEAFTPKQVLAEIEKYRGIDHKALQENLIYFLKQVVPVAEECDSRLAIHPDDPPFPVLGLPRVVSTADDIKQLLSAVSATSNGLCFCTGSLGALKENNIPEMIDEFAGRIHFLHLRNTRSEGDRSFHEAEHLNGDTDMAAVMKRVIRILQERGQSIPMRPDHGHQMLDDLHKKYYPGYSLIGRLKGLAELRGLEAGLSTEFKH